MYGMTRLAGGLKSRQRQEKSVVDSVGVICSRAMDWLEWKGR